MATVTKPDRQQQLEQRNRRALKIARTAAAHASKVQIDEQLNISTRRRQALKIRSDAIDEIEAALTGRSADVAKT